MEHIEPGVAAIRVADDGTYFVATWWHTKFHMACTHENLRKELLIQQLPGRDPGLTHYRDHVSGGGALVKL